MNNSAHHRSFLHRPHFLYTYVVPIVLLLGVLCLSESAHGQLASNATEKIKTTRGHDRLAERLSAGGTARVIVHLDTPFQAMAGPGFGGRARLHRPLPKKLISTEAESHSRSKADTTATSERTLIPRG